MGRVKQLTQIINASEKYEFDKIVKSYLKNIYGYERIVVTDGKDDAGLDIRVFDIGAEKIQYQMTTQKSETTQQNSQLKTKIFEDIQKSSVNAKEYGYSNNLYFFYSYVLANKVKNKYKQEALIQYNINLEIIDAKQIAEESEDCLALQQTIYEQSGLSDFCLKSSLYEDKNKCLMYDLVSFGKCSDLKLEIVEAYILQCLFEKEYMTKDQISYYCIEKFASKENPTFYSNLINKLYNIDKKLQYYKKTQCYSLSIDVRDVFKKRIEQIKLDEFAFVNEIGVVLEKYNQVHLLDYYVSALTELYTDAFCKRIEFKQYLDNEDNVLKRILAYSKKLLMEKDAESMLKQLFSVCNENKYLQKTCASSIFVSKINIDNLEKYATERKQVYIDTTIAINILCLFYQNAEYFDYNYRLSKSLSEYCRKNHIKLYLTERYLWEITGHVREAIDLIPFTKIPKFELLGKSRNVFYNYYSYLYCNGIFDYSYSDFLERFGFRSGYNTDKFNQIIKKYLSEIGIEVVHIENDYDIKYTKKQLEVILAEMDRFKTSFARENDCIMLKYLGDDNSDVHKVDPVFITWDKSLYLILKDFFQDNPTLKKWMQFTPGQFIDRHSLLSFSINSETISQEMLAILSGDIVQHTISLLDSLSLILDPNTEVGLAYTNKITEMKDSQIYTIGKVPKEGQNSLEQDAIDYVVYKLTNLYRDTPEEYKKFKELFSKKEYFDEVITIIAKGIRYYNKNKRFDENNMRADFDKLLINL